jgi:hypothetical protein
MANKNTKIGLIIFFIIVFGLIVIGFIGTFFYNLYTNNNDKQITVTPTQTVSITDNPNESLLNKKFSWDVPEYTYYGDIKWTEIYSGVEDGVAPYKLSKTNGCGDDSKEEFLKYEGGLCQVGYWLSDSSGNEIRTKQKLIEYMGLINEDSKAVSLLALSLNDLQTDDKNIIKGHILAVHEGYLIEIIRKNTFGCGMHIPNSEIYFVDIRGESVLIAQEILPVTNTSENELCVD